MYIRRSTAVQDKYQISGEATRMTYFDATVPILPNGVSHERYLDHGNHMSFFNDQLEYHITTSVLHVLGTDNGAPVSVPYDVLVRMVH